MIQRLIHTADSKVLIYTFWDISKLCNGPRYHIAVVVTTPEYHRMSGVLVTQFFDLILQPIWRMSKSAICTLDKKIAQIPIMEALLNLNQLSHSSLHTKLKLFYINIWQNASGSFLPTPTKRSIKRWYVNSIIFLPGIFIRSSMTYTQGVLGPFPIWWERHSG